MTRPRSSLVSTDVTRYYHCITKCVRQAFLLQEGKTDRKKWLSDRLQEVADVYAVSVAGYGILDNHFHLLLRLDVEVAKSWTNEEVVERWAVLHPPRKNRKPVDVTVQWIADEAQDKKKVKKLRKRLCNLGWFMKEVKEPLARLCNKEDGHQGTFFEGRYKSIAILDIQALLATAIYIDLNPFAAGMVESPELSENTSLFERIENIKANIQDVTLSQFSGIVTPNIPADIEDSQWLIPIEDRRNCGSAIEGMVESFSLANYLLLLDEIARRPREGKSHHSPDALHIFERMGFDPEFWAAQKSRDYSARLMGCFFASSREKLTEAATQLGLHHCWNLTEKQQTQTQEQQEA